MLETSGTNCHGPPIDFTIQADEYFSTKCYIINLKMNVTKNRTFSGISLAKSKSEIHSPSNFLPIVQEKEVIKVSLQLSWQLSCHSNEEYGGCLYSKELP